MRWLLAHRKAKPAIFLCIGVLCVYQVFISTSTPNAVRGAEFRNLFLDDSLASVAQDIELKLKAQTLEGSRECILPDSYERLMYQMTASDTHWRWIAERIQYNWQHVHRATHKLMSEGKLANRTCLYVLVLPGLLTQTNFAQTAFEGGPLGELLQWADLITALHALGHTVTLRYDLQYAALDLKTLFNSHGSSRSGCADGAFDVIFTDLGGHTNLPLDVREKYRKRFRIIDTFGTEVQYNYQDYAQKYNIERSAGLRGLYIKHFYTMYPETVDNSFLGFMVHTASLASVPKENTAVLYGKDPLYVQRKRDFILSLRPFMEIHSTLPSHPVLEALPGVINHGVLRSAEYHSITQKSKFFIGLGDPIEGPGIMEALSRGAIIFQPQLQPPLKFGNLGKPNNRTLHSQVPYLDRIGPPNVLTFQYDDHFQLTEIFKYIENLKVEPKLPYEFTPRAFIERLEMTMTQHDLCTENPGRKKLTSDRKVTAVLSTVADQSCTHVCNDKGLLCDVTAFADLNDPSFLRQLTNCTRKRTEKEVFAPALQGSQCVIQGDSRLFSCASYTDQQLYRICPCIECDSSNQHFCGLMQREVNWHTP